MLHSGRAKRYRSESNALTERSGKREHKGNEQGAEEEIDLSKDYFDNGLFRNASGLVLVKKAHERKLWDFEEILEEADIVDKEDEKKLLFLVANFRDRMDMTFAFEHG